MELPLFPGHKAVDLQGSLATLARSREFLSRLRAEFSEEEYRRALEALASDRLEGSFGARLHDFLVDEIHNESTTAWSSHIFDPDDEEDEDRHFPIWINDYRGVYFVQALEYDPVGYFLSLNDAVGFARSSWENVAAFS